MNENLKNIIKILKSSGVGVMPTDTIYGLVGRAEDKKAVERIYKIKRRNKKKPFIILISNIQDLKKFGVRHPYKLQFVRMLKKLWPGRNSIVLPCTSIWIQRMKYLHRGTGSLAFRLPKKKSLIKILKQIGPLVAPSANSEGKKPAENIIQAKKYFNNKVDFYLSGGTLKGKPSNLIEIKEKCLPAGRQGEIEVLRGKIKL